MTNQEAFDTVARHLLTQKTRSYSVSKDMCLYRGPNGLKCAVGCLIPDEGYDPALEGCSIKTLATGETVFSNEIKKAAMDKIKHLFIGLDIDLLRELQNTHDNYPIQEWNELLRKIASRFSLNTAALDEFTS